MYTYSSNLSSRDCHPGQGRLKASSRNSQNVRIRESKFNGHLYFFVIRIVFLSISLVSSFRNRFLAYIFRHTAAEAKPAFSSGWEPKSRRTCTTPLRVLSFQYTRNTSQTVLMNPREEVKPSGDYSLGNETIKLELHKGSETVAFYA